MDDRVITIDAAGGPGPSKRSLLHGRRLVLASGLAIAEIIAYVVADPSRWAAILLVGAVLAVSIAATGRMRAGAPRDLVLVVGLAQAMVIALPILLGVISLIVATVVVLALIAVFVVIGLRFRR